MATSRSRLQATLRGRMAWAVVAILNLACMTSDGAPQAAAPAEAKIQTIEIEHVTPKRDAVGPLPTKLEWTAVKGVDSYAIKVEDEIEIPVFDQDGITTTSVPWPAGLRIPPGTYFWRIVGIKGSRVVADSGRAAFVVME